MLNFISDILIGHTWSRAQLGLFLLVLVFATACKSDYPSSQRQGRPGDSKTARQVKTARVEETPFGEAVIVNGTLAAYDQTVAGVKVPGRLRSITVDLGSFVRRGQVILNHRTTICASNRQKRDWPRLGRA